MDLPVLEFPSEVCLSLWGGKAFRVKDRTGVQSLSQAVGSMFSTKVIRLPTIVIMWLTSRFLHLTKFHLGIAELFMPPQLLCACQQSGAHVGFKAQSPRQAIGPCLKFITLFSLLFVSSLWLFMLPVIAMQRVPLVQFKSACLRAGGCRLLL